MAKGVGPHVGWVSRVSRVSWVSRVSRVAVAVGLAAYVASILPGVRPQPGFSYLWDLGVYLGTLLAATVVCAVRAGWFGGRADGGGTDSVRGDVRGDRRAWGAITIGLISYSGGALAFLVFLQDLPDIPYPSVADGLWLLLYPMAIAGVTLRVRTRMRGPSLSMWLDGLVSGLGLASLGAGLALPRILQGASGSAAAVVTNAAYPLLDLALAATVVGGMATLGAWRERSWQLLGAGFLVFAAADSWYLMLVTDGGYQQGSVVDATFLVAVALVAAAASVDLRTSSVAGAPTAVPRLGADGAVGGLPAQGSGAESRSFLIPGVFALVAIAVLAELPSRTPTVGVVLAAGALVAAWARTAVAVREVVSLSDSRRQALTDVLTGLPNRRALYQIVESAEAAWADGTAPPGAAMLLTDLDGFKEINDALGHQLGDQLLQEVSRRFATQVPAGGSLARLGGDEMALFVPGLGAADAAALARRLLATLDTPFDLQDMALHLGASIGITVLDPGAGVSRALAKADLAMYRAKESRRGWELYDDQRDGNAWDRLSIVEDLRTALADGGLTVELQPIIDAAGHGPTGMEALVRWNHPLRGRIAPDAFLPLAEKAGLMSAVTHAVLELSLDAARSLQDHGRPIPVSVNLSASDLLDHKLVDFLTAALEARGLTGDALRIEITESLLVDTGAGATDLLHRLRALGVELAVDDYGTGYWCLAYLHDLPVSYLKIDRGFTDRILDDTRTAIIVGSTIDMAHALGLRVVAEGVETADQLAWLAGHGCDLIQGYHVSHPLRLDALHDWLAVHEPTAGAPAR